MKRKFIVLKYTRLLLVFLPTICLLSLQACKTTGMAQKNALYDSTVVFQPAAGQYASMRIPALVVTKKGSLLAFCEGRISSASDWSDMDLLMRRSTDGGKTWSAYKVIAQRQGGNPTSNPTPIVDRNGTIHLLFQRDYAVAYYTQSTDDGQTWSTPKDITYAFERFKPEYDWKVIAPGPGHSIQLKNGRLLVPVWMAASEKMTPHRSHYPSRVATIYSDDLGKTWERGELIPESPEVHNPSEMMAVELNDGRVMLSIRHNSENHRRAISYSSDGAGKWTIPTLNQDLFEPVCMASILRIPQKTKEGKSVLLFVNPDSHDLPKYPRKKLTAKLSYDEGETWPVHKLIEAGSAGYSDIAAGADGTIYCLYETNNQVGWNYSLVLKKFNLAWLTDGKQELKK